MSEQGILNEKKKKTDGRFRVREIRAALTGRPKGSQTH